MLKISMPSDPAIPLREAHPTEMIAYVHQKTGSRMFTAALFMTG